MTKCTPPLVSSHLFLFFFFAPQVLSWKHYRFLQKQSGFVLVCYFFSSTEVVERFSFLALPEGAVEEKEAIKNTFYTVLLYSCWHSRLIVAIYPNYHNVVQSPSVCHHHAASSGCPMLYSLQLMRPVWLRTFFYFLCLNRNNLFAKDGKVVPRVWVQVI